jgi:hypothetical protein
MRGSRRFLAVALIIGVALALMPSAARHVGWVAAAAQLPAIQVTDETSTVIPNTFGTPGMPVNFPATTVGVPVSRTLTVSNIGGGDLALANLTFPTGFSGGFGGSATSALVPVGTPVSLVMTCTPTAVGTISGLVQFNTNDADDNPFTFTVSCTATAPVTPPGISVADGVTPVTNGQASPVVLPNTLINVQSSKQLTISNTGSSDLTLSNLAFTSVFTGSFASATVVPSGTTTLTINCLSAAAGTFDGTVTFNTNDPNNLTFTFPVRCTVSASAPEIEVLDGAIVITDGQAAPVFIGTGAVGGIINRNFTVRNNGTANLNVSNLVVGPAQQFQGQFGGTIPVVPGGTATLTIICFSQSVGSFTGTVQFDNNDSDENPFNFSVRCDFAFQTPTNTPTTTATGGATATRTPTATRTLVPTFPIPTSFLTPGTPGTFFPSLVPTFTPQPTFIFTPFQRTPPPAPACARQAPGIPSTGVVFVVNRDGVNVRTFPAIGAEVIGFVNAGYTFEAQARSGNNEWVRVQFAPGQQGWIGVAVLSLLNGTLESLPVADPRTIPYGGFEQPRAGITGAVSNLTGRLAQSGLRLRSGPSTNYAILANAPRYTIMEVFGRTADNRWVQVKYQDVLGWAAAEYFEFSSAEVFNLPIDGICSDGVPISSSTDSDFFEVLRQMLSRLDLAQPSLDAIRGIWTQIALGGAAACGRYPIRPTDYLIATPLLAVYFDELNPLQTDFNTAMAALRRSIELLIDACNVAQPATGSVGQAVVQQALEAVNIADALFADVRRRILERLPPDTIGQDECLFVYNAGATVVKRLEVGQPRNAQLTSGRPRVIVVGFCFDAPAGQTFRVEILRLSGNSSPRVTISNFNNPTNFLAQTNLSSTQEYSAAFPILIPQDGRYLVLVSDVDLEAGQQGDFVVLLTNITGVVAPAPSLSRDPNTGQVLVNPVISPSIPQAPTPSTGATCPNVTFTCQQLISCDQAFACLVAGNVSLDGDLDGVPCEENLCIASTPRPTLFPGGGS